jgi:hypothetical protein
MKSRILPLLTAVMLGGAAANAQCPNFVSNPDGSAGMTDWAATNGWISITTDHSLSSFQIYGPVDTLVQTIDLSAGGSGLTNGQLASKPTINFSQKMKVSSVWGCTGGADYNFTVTVEDASHNALQTWTTGTQTTNSMSSWETVQHSFVNYGGTPQYVTIVAAGTYCKNSSWDEGLAITGATVNAVVSTLTADSTIAQAIQGANSVISYDDPATCFQTGVVLSTTTSDLGSTTVRTMLDNSVKSFNGQPYVPRHFEITPTTQDTATVTLYVDQADFDAYNAARGSFLPLPASGDTSDVALANLSISAFHGTPSGGFDPGNYSGTTQLIPNSDITKVWNADANRWEFSFSIDHFSGFFIAGGMTVLPITMGDLNLNTRNGHHMLNWNTYTEGRDDYFVIERSADGRNFSAIEKIQATGHAGAYAYTDANTPAGTSYYRIKLVDGQNGKADYSNTVIGRTNVASVDVVTVSPNPASGTLNVRLNGGTEANGTLSLTDAAGKEVKQMDISGSSMKVDILDVPAGLYFLSARTGDQVQTIKVTVQ